MGIILRGNKGSALTWDEVDENWRSLYYSSSISASTLCFYFTGSCVTHSVELPSGGSGVGGIFTQTGSFYATTNDLQVTGSFNVDLSNGDEFCVYPLPLQDVPTIVTYDETLGCFGFVNVTSGTSGFSGTSGTTGMSGTSGTSGTEGTSGESSSSGSSGESGTSGTTGSNGTSGEEGTSGLSGTSGSTGSAGTGGES